MRFFASFFSGICDMLSAYRSGKNTPGASAIDRQALFDCRKVVWPWMA